MSTVFDDKGLQERSVQIQERITEAFKDLEAFLADAFDLATKIERERICAAADKAGLHTFAAAVREGREPK